MKLVVAGVGILAVLIGLLGLAAPIRFRAVFQGTTSQARFVAAITVRLGLGAFLWIAADELRFPYVMRIIAAISLFAAVAILLMVQDASAQRKFSSGRFGSSSGIQSKSNSFQPNYRKTSSNSNSRQTNRGRGVSTVLLL